MIYTLTVNPAIDYTVSVENFTLGRVNRTLSEQIFIGGKGINVSCVLNNLGVKSTALGFAAGFTGEAIVNGLEKLGVKTDFVMLQNGASRINVKLKAEHETEINGQGPHIPNDKLKELFDKIDGINSGDMLVLAGSVPNTLPKDIYQQIMRRLSEKDVRFVVDATGELLKNCLAYEPFLIKPNNFELSEIIGKQLVTDEQIADGARHLQKMGAKNVLVSMAANGALLLTENGDVHRIGIVKGKTVNSVGAGDSMVAGFLAGYTETGDYEYALKLGTAAGGATALSPWLGERDMIFELIKKL